MPDLDYYYQGEAVQALYDYFGAKSGNPVIVLPTGSGKSHVIADFVQSVISRWPDQRIIMLTHIKELIQQNMEKLLLAWPDAPVGIYSAGIGRRDTDDTIIFAGIQSVYRKSHELGAFALAIIDECFVAGTQIKTPDGDIPIEQIMPGQVVFNAVGKGRVIATSEKQATDIYEVKLSNGKIIECTGNHPFFTDSGWKEASTLANKESIFSFEDMRKLRKCVQAVDKINERQSNQRTTRAKLEKARFLFNQVCKECESNRNDRRSKSEDKRNTKENWTQAKHKRWEWKTAPETSKYDTANIRGWLGCGASDKNECWASERSIPELLQSRSRKPGIDDSNRARWWESLHIRKAAAGQEERQSFGSLRVVSVSRQKRKSERTVYNLQVSGHPSYFANGVAVHNCHLINPSATGMYRRFLADQAQMNPKLKTIGLTATPFRTTYGDITKSTDEKKTIFDDVAYEKRLVELINEGYLSPLIPKKPKQDLDVSGVKIRAGEFIQKDLSAAVDVDDLTQAAVKEMLTYAEDRKSWLVFCVGIDHSYHVAAALRKHGVTAETITSRTPKDQREKIIRDFKAGKIRALSNAQVLMTGFDAPQVDMIAFLRPTASPVLYLQMCGRGTRLAPGKENCLVLDFAGNVMRHGPLDMITAWDPADTIPGRAPTRVCPECDTINAVAKKECMECGYVFPVEEKEKHDRRASVMEIISGTVPKEKPRWRKIRSINYAYHRKRNAPEATPTLRVNYSCGGEDLLDYRTYSEWICFEHIGYAREKAITWWRSRSIHDFGISPHNITEAIEMISWLKEGENFREPTAILVDESGRYPRILEHEFEPASKRQSG